MPDTNEKTYEIFKKSREERGLSLSDVANALHLTVTMIEQIEAGEFVHRHLAPVFIRGYIRSYGKYLNLPESIIDEIVGTLSVENPVKPAEKTKFIHVKQDKRQNAKHPTAHNSKKVFVYLLVVALLIIVASFWHGGHKAEPAVELVPTVEQPESTLSEPEEPLTEESTATSTESDTTDAQETP